MSKKAKILLLISGLFTLSIALSNVFVNVFLWKRTQDFIMIGKYNLMHYIFIPLTFIFAGWLSKKKNGIWPLRIGIIFFLFFFIFILLLKDKVTNYIYFLGILFGIASGFYWLSFNVLSFDFTSIHNRDTFNGLYGFTAGISNAVGPLAAAYIIEHNKNTTGYTIVFVISLILFIVLILISLLLKSKHYGETLYFKKIFIQHNNQWKKLRKAKVAWGLRDVVILFLISILIYQSTKSELSLGKLTFFSYIISSVAYITQQKIIKPSKRKLSLYLGASFMFIAVISLIIKIDYWPLVIYVTLDALFAPFFIVPMSSATFNLLSESHEENMRIEYIISNEFSLNTGRIISITILLLALSFVENSNILNYFILFIGSSQFISLYFLKKLNIWKY